MNSIKATTNMIGIRIMAAVIAPISKVRRDPAIARKRRAGINTIPMIRSTIPLPILPT